MGNSLSQYVVPETIGVGASVVVVVLSLSKVKVIPIEEKMTSTLVNTAHVTSLAMWFGIQSWQTFVVGLTLLTTIPRPWFSKAQMALFPRYFTVGTLMNGVAFGSFVSRHPVDTWQGKVAYKGVSLAGLWLLFPLCLYLEPKMFELVKKRDAIEMKHDQGDVIGLLRSELVKNDPEYQQIMRQFHRYHGIFMVLNFLQYGICGYYCLDIARTARF